jgi:hypothetical protein
LFFSTALSEENIDHFLAVHAEALEESKLF